MTKRKYEIEFVDKNKKYTVYVDVQGDELTIKGIDGTHIAIVPPPTTFIPIEKIKVNKLEETTAKNKYKSKLF